MASHLIGISGRKRSGKDTFAARLIEAHGFTRVAFADPLKAVALDLDPIVVPETWAGPEMRLSDFVARNGWEIAKETPEVRRLLQALGVAVRDHVDTDAWVSAAMRQVDEIPGPVVITDVRFPNEVDVVREWHTLGWVDRRLIPFRGKVVRVNRPGLPETDLHVSETALDDIVPDFLVRNIGTIADLHGFADGVARTVLAGS